MYWLAIGRRVSPETRRASTPKRAQENITLFSLLETQKNARPLLFLRDKSAEMRYIPLSFHPFTVTMANTITKRELVNKICAETRNNLTQNDVLDVIQRAIEMITEALGNGDRVVLRNFGTFVVKEVKAKIGRNPKDPGKDVPIPARRVVKFKVGKNLREAAARTEA